MRLSDECYILAKTPHQRQLQPFSGRFYGLWVRDRMDGQTRKLLCATVIAHLLRV